jgi:gliding motility-associated-like protein
MSGNYVVTVTDNNGCVNANIAQVTVNPALVISASNNGPLCVNATLNLNASAGVSWSWSGPGVFTSFSQNPSIPNIQLANAGTYIVTGIDQNGCSGTDSTTVVVNPLPVISANSDTICAGQQSATLIANGGVTYTWSPSLGLNNTNGSTVVANPMVNVTYTVTGTDVNGCSNTANSTVSVNQPPIVTATSATVCLGNSGTLTASGAATYTWAPSTGLNQNTGSSVTSSPSSTTSYTIIGVDNNGCYNSGVCTVVVNPLPVFTVSSGTICAGASTTLNANGTSSYSWFPATGLNVTSGPNVTASPSATTTYSVIGTDLNNCSDTMTTSVTVNPLPQVSIIPKISSGCSPVCVTTFSNTTSANGTCNWTFSDGTTSSYCTPGHCFSGQGTFYSIMTLTDGNGCKGKDSAKVIVYPIPNADFNWQPQPASILDPIIGFYNESSGAMINTWKWSFGDPGNHTSLLQNPSFDFENAGTYTTQLLVISNYGCVDSVSKVVVIDADYMIYVPNAFTPNDDGTNEIFSAKGEGIDEFRMYIFDRWGNEVFFSDDIYKGWDGRYQAKGNDILPQDLYVWKIELKTYKGEAKMLKGTVSLLK